MTRSKGTKISIVVPSIEQLDDEGMRAIAPLRDGRWSEQTKSILAKFGTQMLSLNRSWAATWTGWTCPCCGRSKPQIARLASSGTVLCHLEQRHDHLEEFLKRRFSAVDLQGDERDHRIQISHAEAALRPLVERFERTLICVDCNLSDGRVKLALRDEVDSHFTFTPSEIAEFITVSDNHLHEVNITTAHSLWVDAQEDFYDRIDFVKRMAKRIAKGRHKREIALGQKLHRQVQTRDVVYQLCAEQLPSIHSLHLGEIIDSRSVARGGLGETLQRSKKHGGGPPTDAEFAAINAAQASTNRHWREAGEAWACPCCERAKREICRRSNRGAWTARIHSFEELEFETDTEQLSMRRQNGAGDIVISAPRRELICQDCRGIVSQFRQRSADLDARVLSLEDLRILVACSTKNAAHDIDSERVEEMIVDRSAFLDAIDEFEAHQRLVTATWIEYLKLTKSGLSDAQARDLIGFELAKARDWDVDDGEDFVDWLLDEAERLSAKRRK
ncbi:hypothetical protein [Nereida sp. MMG025]|uniref:hypothetical protein n=1 Tax=Nereida sp. MMG025 TaxID=2909981 RepID=UPI001F196F36|nr:hypothetical protein [Nereida sp. MMG025]MCF6445684.1 hypothetical protein [Nereida sp. MMG025]